MSLIVLLVCVNYCRACDSGQVEDKGFLGLSWFSSCEDCTVGTFQSESECKECEAGYYTNLTRQTKCSSCPRGTFSAHPGSVECTECPAGEYSSVTAASSCIPCSPGFYTRTPGNTECAQCPGGSYSSEEGSRKCEVCEDRMTSPAGSTSSANCTGSCSAGYIHTSENSTVLCEECVAGTFSLQGAVECSECSTGQFSVPGSGACSVCSPGTYTNSSGSEACLPCFPGTYTNISRSEACLPCSPGTYTNISSSRSCFHCPPGTVTSLTGSSNCTSCPENTYSNSNNTACLQCPPGAHSNTGSSDCVTCETGFYHNVSSNSCLKCPETPGSALEGCLQLVEHESPVLNPTIEPVSESMYQSLSERQITAIVLSFIGIAVILSVSVYAVCWTQCKLHDMRYSPRSAGLGESIANTGANCTYSSCTEVTSGVQQTGEENIYDVPGKQDTVQ